MIIKSNIGCSIVFFCLIFSLFLHTCLLRFVCCYSFNIIITCFIYLHHTHLDCRIICVDLLMYHKSMLLASLFGGLCQCKWHPNQELQDNANHRQCLMPTSQIWVFTWRTWRLAKQAPQQRLQGEMALKGVIVVKGFRQVACNSPLHMLNQVDYLCFSIVFAVISAI
jgi:hypothetical protein